jgi:glyoxylase-like metal-dependent hydrolase (beta-lactamase superfamily II)
LHFDHAGGNTYKEGSASAGEIRLSFPNARYMVQKGEFDWAHSKNERVRASYLPDNFDPVFRAGKLELLEGEREILPGLSVVLSPGHTPHHQSVVLHSEGQTAIYLADVMPTSAHLPLAWIMGYDVEPLKTLESKRGLVTRARAEDWLLIFEHDPEVPWGRIDPREEKPVLIAEGEGGG